MAPALIVMTPLVAHGWDEGTVLIYGFGPAYMLHQVEEHAGDRFRCYINTRVFGGVQALSPMAVLWINLPGVWGLNGLALVAACMTAPGWGLTAPYLAVVNAVVHIATALRFGEYNPGLVTSLLLFLPLGLWALQTVPATAAQHWAGLGIAVVAHIVILVVIGTRLSQLRRA